MKNISRAPYFIILLLWLCSVAIRIPQLNRPLSKHHEFVTAHALRVMQIWNELGVAHFYFSPAMNYSGAANKYINNQATENFDAEGNAYYLSYPPGGLLLPFFLLGGWIQTPSALALELFNLLLHLIECLLLYNICLLIAARLNKQELGNRIGIIAVMVHLFSPCLLWFHGNVYFVDMPALTLWLWCLWLWMKYNINSVVREDTNHDNKKKYRVLLILFLSSFALSYTEYLGVTYAIVIFCSALFNRKNLAGAVSVVSGSVCALLLMLYQYSLIGGWEKLFSFLQTRYATRSGYAHGNLFALVLPEVEAVCENYLTGFAAWILLLAIHLILNRKKIFSRLEVRDFRFATTFLQFSILLFVPVLLHHILFLNASAHDFQQMKASPFISVAIGLGFVALNKNWMKISFVVALVANIFLFELINPPGKTSLTEDNYDFYEREAQVIKQNSKPDEVIFLKGIPDDAQLIWYGKRNMRTINSDEEAKSFLQKHNMKRGVIFIFDERQLIRAAQHIELSE